MPDGCLPRTMIAESLSRRRRLPLRVDLERLRAAWPVPAELTRRGHSLRGRRGRCPIHGGEKSKSTSFAVSADGQLFCCHSQCGGGSVFTLVMLLDGMDFRAAVKTVAHAAGLAPRSLRPNATQERHRAAITARRRKLFIWRNRRLLEPVDLLREIDKDIELIRMMLKRHAVDAWPGPSTCRTPRMGRDASVPPGATMSAPALSLLSRTAHQTESCVTDLRSGRPSARRVSR